MSIVKVTDDGILQVSYDGGSPLPNETHILVAPSGGKWTFLAHGGTGAVTVTDGAVGVPETVLYQSPDGTIWRLLINDAGTLFLSDASAKRIISPVGNDQFKKADGSIAVGYALATLYTGTSVPAPTWGAREGFVFQPNPIPLNALGLPALPIFIEIGVTYDFVLFDELFQEVYRWKGVSAGVNVATEALTEWKQGTVATFLSAASFSVAADQRAIYTIGRRVKLQVAAGLVFGTVSLSKFSGGVTIISVRMDENEVLTDPIIDLDYALLTAAQSSVPSRRIRGLETQFAGAMTIKDTQPFNLLPPGIIGKFGSFIPSRWSLCDGKLLLRADFPELFKAIGTTYGSTLPTNFRVPDLRGRMSLGKDDMGGVAAGRVTAASVGGANAVTLGGVGGEETHIVTIPELARHDHAENLLAGTMDGATSTGPAAPGPMLTSPTGGGGAHNTMPPWLALNKAIWCGGEFVLDTVAFSDGYSLAYY